MPKESRRPGRILPLDAQVVGKIAAGEVVENPASMIKELVENSIDAGATAITVEIREGGIAYTRVTDNGSGIAHQDIRMAFERHATSKIRTAEELVGVSSLGFRGEALASIAAVAKVQLTTRTAQDEQGLRARVAGGVFEDITPAASPEGTSIVVEDLFFNTPARLKFLRKPRTEGGRVADMLLRLMLSHPEISFRYLSDGKQTYHSPGDGKAESVVFSLFGRETAAALVPVDFHELAAQVSGLVGVGNASRGSRGFEFFFLNGRAMRHNILSKAVEAACAERVMIGQYPFCVLYLEMPGEWMDVNVHPNKLDVRFADEQRIYDLVFDAVRGSLQEGQSLQNPPEIHLTPPSQKEESTLPVTLDVLRPEAEQIRTVEEGPGQEAQGPSFAQVVQSYFNQLPTPPTPKVRGYGTESSVFQAAPPLSFAPYAGEAPLTETATPPEEAPEEKIFFRTIGVAFSTYLIVESRQQLLLIDQHAVHERLLYEELKAALSAGEGAQTLLMPFVTRLTPAQADRLSTYEREVREAGFEVEMMGEDSVQVRAVPLILGEPAAKYAFQEVLEQLGDLRVLGTWQKRRDAIVQMACKKAVKGGDTLHSDEIESLLRELFHSETPPTCPHGRPLVVALTQRELEKRFKRIQ